jgi:hypothetical protein
MKTIIYILTFLFSTTLLCGQSTDKQVKLDTIVYGSKKCRDCPVIMDTVVYKLLKCGLYLGSNGDLGYRTEEIYNDNFDRRTRYITWIYGADQNDTLNGGLKEMKFVIDTSSFRFLSDLYWADKNNIYGFNPMSDGGTVYLSDIADRKTFVVLGGAGYAKDKTNVYYRGSVIEGADLKTFRDIKYKEISELACDKLYLYQIGRRMTDKEIKEFGLDNYKK